MEGVYTTQRKPEGYRQLTVADAAVALSTASGGVPSAATSAVILVETESTRWRDDGGTPTASVGMLASAATRIELNSRKQINQFRIIRTGANSAAVSISYYSADRKAYN